MGIELARLVIVAVPAAALLAALPMHRAGPAAAPIVETAPADLSPVSKPPAGGEPRMMGAHSLDPAAVARPPEAAMQGDPDGGWFDETELKLNAVGGDKTDMLVDPNACVYPDSFLRNLAGGRDDCGFLKPGPDESKIVTLPFLALSGWVLVICAVAALYRFRREWRVRRWLRHMRAQGLAPSAPYSRRSPRRRSQSRHRSAPRRRYAG